MKRSKFLIYMMIIISIILCVPSIVYLINNKTVDGFNSYYTYTLTKPNDKLLNGIIVIGLLLIFSILYFLIIKKEKKIFKSEKQIFLFVMIISLIFTIILPFLSSDIYYYIGDSWLDAKYGENPYYTTVQDLQESGINDEILNNTGYWRNTTSVYGPLWSIISKMLVTFSFGSVTIALFVFKLASFLVHILNCYIIYKLTKSKKYILLYGLNPLVLVELLSNVHNDIYLILFVLLALYFLIKKKNIYLTIIFLALSISIKYSTILLIPFILIYYFKDKTIPKRILFCTISGVAIISIVVLLYMIYYRDFTIFTNMLVQSSRYSQSIMTYLSRNIDSSIFEIIKALLLPTFAVIYVTILVVILFKRKLSITEIMRKYNYIMLIFIFVVLTNFQKWYILWLLPTIIWQSKNMRKFILYLTISAIIPSMRYFLVAGDPFIKGIKYSIDVLLISIALLIINVLIKKGKARYIKFKNERNKLQNL